MSLIKHITKYIIIYLLISLDLISITGCGNQKTNQNNTQNNNYKTYLAIATEQIKNKNFSQAQKNLLKADKISPNNPEIQIYLGKYYLKVKEPEQADIYFNKAIKSDPKSSEIQNQYGLYLCNQNKINQAIKYFDKAIRNKKYQNIAQAYQNKGVCLYKLFNQTNNNLNIKAKNKTKTNIKKNLKKSISHNPKLALSYLILSEIELKDISSNNKNNKSLKSKKIKIAYNYIKAFDNLAEQNDRSRRLHQQLDNTKESKPKPSPRDNPMDTHRHPKPNSDTIKKGFITKLQSIPHIA
jgi:Tfp pilus assembly protein PilF